ncbi:efflux RND transporter permease subunit [Aristophania vespae]|uniref:efflux RND transporter permease subunit n=1 Tax=Aristophania vespae TaxID=2697033 RepID=UPI0023511C4A|nr:efflux RND transporter permease subunit [Aristophania vespae]UMM63608.1 Multidrug resistance protein MdtC [Aristophania vespae]
MKLVRFFVRRPVGTTLMALAMFLGGILGFIGLPVADLPNVEYPVIMVTATQPGGSPSEIASTVAEPLERHLEAIAGVREITSQSTVNQTRILLQFELTRDINGAARDVQAALRAARQDLPTSLRQDPKYMKANANGPPIMVLSVVSSTRTPQQLFDFATNIIVPGLSQVEGVGNVAIRGSALPAVRVELNPLRLFRYGIGFEDIRAALASANAHTPKGFIEVHGQRLTLATNDQANGAKAYRDLIIAYRNNQPVQLSDVADIIDSKEDLRQGGYINGQPAIICTVYAQSGANIIKTINHLKARFPSIEASLPGDSTLTLHLDRSTAIRAALTDTERTLILSVLLVVLVVMLFLHDLRATFIPALIVPLATVTTFGVMKLFGYQLDTLSLMALTIATGFIVDDAIVVLENIIRYLEKGHTPYKAAILGASEVTFTVISITLSLIVVFLPILLMQGIAGMFFHEFAMTMIIALTVSLILSLSLTPMMSAVFLKKNSISVRHNFKAAFNVIYYCQNIFQSCFNYLIKAYERSLNKALYHPRLIILSLPLTLALAALMFIILPKELFPQQDHDMIMGRLVADQSVSFHALQLLTQKIERKLANDPDVISVIGGLGKRSANSVNFFVTLRPRNERKDDISTTIHRLNQSFSHHAGGALHLRLPSLIGGGARSSDGAYQYSLQGSSAEELYSWTPKLVKALSHLPLLTDVTSDTEQNGRGITLFLNRDVEARYKVTPQLASQTLYDAFGQRSASVIYGDLNQYHVVMEAAPRFWSDPSFLKQMWVSTAGGTAHGGTASNNVRVRTNKLDTSLSQSEISYRNSIANALAGGKSASNGAAVTTSREIMIPLSLIGQLNNVNEPLAVNHQGQFVSTTISFNLAPGASLGPAITSVQEALIKLHIPPSIHGGFAGSAANFKKTVNQEPLLICAALIAVYIVLGILYESLIHPLTILSTLPSAGVGALIATALSGKAFSLLTLIGIILLIGIVKKNAIMLIDFALQEQKKGLSAYKAIHKASLLRFRPIIMTSFAAALGALPLLIGHGSGSELRRPLGISILGGLCLSQLFTLYTTPVVYLYLDRFGRFVKKSRKDFSHRFSLIK